MWVIGKGRSNDVDEEKRGNDKIRVEQVGKGEALQFGQ